MTPRPHDVLFKLAFEAPANAAALLGELLPAAIRGAVAWDTATRVPSSFVDPALDERFNDLLFSVRLYAGDAATLYLLLEHQSTDDPTMTQRTLSYQARLWDRLRRERRVQRREPSDEQRKGGERRQAPREAHEWLAPVIAVVVNHVPGGWSSARALEDMFDPALRAIPGLAALLPRFTILVEDLAHRSDDDIKASSLGAFQKLALWLLRDGRDPAELLNSFDSWTSTMLQAERGPSGIEVLQALFTYMFRVVHPVHLDDLRAKIRWLGRRAEETAMTIAEYLHKEGRIATLRDLLLVKFELQALESPYEERLRAASPEMLEHLVRRLLMADTLDSVFDG
jgi:Putative transposase, YhgA-like